MKISMKVGITKAISNLKRLEKEGDYKTRYAVNTLGMSRGMHVGKRGIGESGMRRAGVTHIVRKGK